MRKQLRAIRGTYPSAEQLRDIPEVDFSRPSREHHLLKSIRAAVQNPLPSRKQQVTVRLDADVFQWLKGMGKGYQTKLNRILRAAMEASASR